MFNEKPNSQYSGVAPMSLAERIGTYQRRRMYARFLKESGAAAKQTILDVGVTNDRTYESSNYLEAWYPHKNMITAIGTDRASFLKDIYPGMRILSASGLDLPFKDKSFDIVHSSAVIEHVGSFENQIKFIKECTRVARKTIFITTPNRWFPVEVHTVLPLVHWLPKPWFRDLLEIAGYEFFAKESNLNLLSRRDLLRIARLLFDVRISVSSVFLMGWPSNLIMIGHKR